MERYILVPLFLVLNFLINSAESGKITRINQLREQKSGVQAHSIFEVKFIILNVKI